jgi:hypothetical protein
MNLFLFPKAAFTHQKHSLTSGMHFSISIKRKKTKSTGIFDFYICLIIYTEAL